jgi:hypothetical protein
MCSGDFEIHLTGSEWEADRLAAFAAEREVKFSHIQLDRGATPLQPMVTVKGSGTLTELRALAERWRADLRDAGLAVLRVKIEAAPWNDGVPQADADADGDRYFEHHVKVLLPSRDPRVLSALTEIVTGHDARVSRNARRARDGGLEERFVTQRCHGVGQPTARTRLDGLLSALRASDHEVLEVEEEFVVSDDALDLDRGWFQREPAKRRESRSWGQPAPRPGDFGVPPTYLPLPVRPGQEIHQVWVFDPALKQFSQAYRAGEPVFGDAADGTRWHAARRAAMAHVLAVVAASPWAEHLVLRGSMVLRAWLGDAAREPGDLDFVVTPRSFAFDGPETKTMLDGLVAAIAADPGPGVRADLAVTEHIWTYDRVPGRRIMFPFDVDGLPQGTVQVDLVFNEHMPEPPVSVEIPPLGTSVLAASARLSLAWKLEWLINDFYPQGKDLYDAALLAEYAAAPRAGIRALMREDLGRMLDEFLADIPSMEVDWHNFRDEYPDVTDDVTPWLQRLAHALRD